MLKKITIASIALFLAALASGCTSSTAAPAGKQSAAKGMMCPKCETTWVTTVTDQGTKVQRLSSTRQMTCPDCDAQAEAYLKDGQQILHNCPACKVTPIEVKPATTSHPKGTHS